MVFGVLARGRAGSCSYFGQRAHSSVACQGLGGLLKELGENSTFVHARTSAASAARRAATVVCAVRRPVRKWRLLAPTLMWALARAPRQLRVHSTRSFVRDRDLRTGWPLCGGPSKSSGAGESLSSPRTHAARWVSAAECLRSSSCTPGTSVPAGGPSTPAGWARYSCRSADR